MKLDDVISLRDAADELGITPTTLRAQAAEGRFEARNIEGLGWITTQQAVERYREERLGKVGRPRVIKRGPVKITVGILRSEDGR
jgi:hypothetical protein